MAYRSFGRFRQAFTHLDMPPCSLSHHPISDIAPLDPRDGLIGIDLRPRLIAPTPGQAGTGAYQFPSRSTSIATAAALYLRATRIIGGNGSSAISQPPIVRLARSRLGVKVFDVGQERRGRPPNPSTRR